MKKFFIVVLCVLLAIGISACNLASRWFNTGFGNIVDHVDQKIDDATNYDTRKEVEDSCRAMVSSYEADKLTWEQYNGSDNSEQQSWADQAKMRANRTASTYNNYILKNSYVWNGNIPSDIMSKLEYIE